MPRKAPAQPTKSQPAGPSKTPAALYKDQCSRAAVSLTTKFKYPHDCRDPIERALLLAYQPLLAANKQPPAELNNFYHKAKHSDEFRASLAEAQEPKQREALLHRAIFERFAFAPPKAQERYAQHVDAGVVASKVTSDCHAMIAQGTLTPNEFSAGKGIANIHKEHGFDQQRQSCT